MVFQVGKTTDSAVLQKLYIENELFGDIVITNLEEDYNKLTLNVLTSFIWASKYCGDAMLVYKTDDDSYLKLSTLEQHIGDALDQIEVRKYFTFEGVWKFSLQVCAMNWSHI